jgi:hypothetical protein
MNKDRLPLALILVLIGMSIGSPAPCKGSSRERGRQQSGNVVSEQERNYGAWVGSYLARGFLRNCGAFIGSVQDVVDPDEQQARGVDRRSLSYTKVTVVVEEWLYGDRRHYADVLQLEQVPVVRGLVYGSEYRGAVWRDVQIEVGTRLLLLFYPKASQDAEMQTSIDRYGLVVSQETLFPAIKDTLSRHTQLKEDPDQLLNATNWLNADKYQVFGGYLVYHLWATAGRDHLDSAAIALSQLMSDKRIPESGRWLLEMPLVRVLSDRENSMSEAARTQAMEQLVTAGCSQSAPLAKSALRVLTLLGEVGVLDLKPFLTQARRQMLRSNYQQLVHSEFEKERRAKFESQLSIKAK